MSALARMIDQAIGEVIAEHPKLFAEKSVEKTRKLLVRKIMKTLTAPQSESYDPHDIAMQSSAGESVAADDPRALAYCQLRIVAGAVAPFRSSGDQVYLPREGDVSAVRPFADLPPKKQWPFISDRAQLTAWREFFDETLPDVSRRSIMETRDGQHGAFLPWLWPPSKLGKVYEAPGAAA